MKNVQIPFELFINLIKIHILDIKNEEIEKQVKKDLIEKFNSVILRDLYTKYKTAKTDEEREKARQAYLEKIGMKDSFKK